MIKVNNSCTQPAKPAAKAAPIALLNAPVLTTMGWFHMESVSLQQARDLVRWHGFVSAIGHASTAAVLSELLNIECPVSRVDFQQSVGQSALVLRLARRLPEGKVLQTRAAVEAWGYNLALLTRLDYCLRPQICDSVADL